jgi:hypothetical protein
MPPIGKTHRRNVCEIAIAISVARSAVCCQSAVNYQREGDVFTTTSYRQRIWWRNLRGGTPVTLHVRGQDLPARSEVIENDAGVAGHLTADLQDAPKLARYFDVALRPDGQPRSEDVARAAKQRVIVKTILA